jgi:hypothetical protein
VILTKDMRILGVELLSDSASPPDRALIESDSKDLQLLFTRWSERV